jgi:hypothetical protein
MTGKRVGCCGGGEGVVGVSVFLFFLRFDDVQVLGRVSVGAI